MNNSYLKAETAKHTIVAVSIIAKHVGVHHITLFGNLDSSDIINSQVSKLLLITFACVYLITTLHFYETKILQNHIRNRYNYNVHRNC